ncbi:MAG: hypothetical protein ACFFBI_14085 [Promethearchaeota archaeon]
MKSRMIKSLLFCSIIFSLHFLVLLNININGNELKRQKNSPYYYPNSGDLPLGMIAIWSGSIDTIPHGWTLCDGSNGTPDLTNRFVMCINNSEYPGVIGGSRDHFHNYSDLPNHNHGIDDPGHDHWITSAGSLTFEVDIRIMDYNLPTPHWTQEYDTSMVTTGITLEKNGTNNCKTFKTEHLPPYYSLAYIMKTSSDAIPLPEGIIVMYPHKLESIPEGWELCSGWEDTPDLTDRFIMCVNNSEDLGTTGGSIEHSHTYSDLPFHTHNITDPGHSHKYDYYNLFWFQQGDQITLDLPTLTNSTVDVTGISVNDTGSNDCETYLADSLPPHHKLAFIMKKTTDALLPPGSILMWAYDLNFIPNNWIFCNGSYNTPNLTERFPLCVSRFENPGVIGGAMNHNHSYSDIPRHTHEVNDLGHSHEYYRFLLSSLYVNDYESAIETCYSTITSHSMRNETGITIDESGKDYCETNTSTNLPPYYKLAFIQFQISPSEFNLYSDIVELPDRDGNFNLKWNNSDYADNYSIYSDTALINFIHDNLNLLANHSAIQPFPIAGLSDGKYYFVCVAHNRYGDTLSNCLEVEVKHRIDVPGYSVVFLIGIIFVTSTLIIKKYTRKLN